MDIQDLRIFTRVAAVQNLSAVGAEFSLTPGTISKRLQALEDELSVRLFDRTTRSIRITEEGLMFLDHAGRILDEWELARASVDGNLTTPRGKLKVLAPPQLGERDTAAAVAGFMHAFPLIDLHVELSERSTSLHEDGIDIAVRVGSLADCALIAKRLANDPQVVVGAPRYLSTCSAPRTPADLERHSCLVQGDCWHWPFARGGKERSVRVNGRLRSNDAALLHRAAVDGHGLVRISLSRVRGDIEAGRLRTVLDDYDTTGDAAIWALYPKNRHILPRMRVFLDFLAEWMRAENGFPASSPVIGQTNGAEDAIDVSPLPGARVGGAQSAGDVPRTPVVAVRVGAGESDRSRAGRVRTGSL